MTNIDPHGHPQPDPHGDSPGDQGPRELICSARRCRAQAAWGLRWNNPALHAPSYRKVWLSCPQHLEKLTGFLQERGFGYDVVPVSQLD